MKKKILTAALAVALIAIMVGGSLAYFTAEDQVSNTFTIGSVQIDIYENGAATQSDTIAFGKLTPVVNTADPSQDESYFDKVVDVKNTGANDAYIRTHIAIPTVLIDYLQLDTNTEGWSDVVITTAQNGAYTVFTYDHLASVAPGTFTAELLQGAYLKSNVDLEENASGDLEFILRNANGEKTAASGFVAHTRNADGSYTSATVSILVAAQAIQAEGFSSATAALNSGFGVNTNPWQ